MIGCVRVCVSVCGCLSVRESFCEETESPGNSLIHAILEKMNEWVFRDGLVAIPGNTDERRQRRRDEQDELDSLEMSQIFWDVDPFDEAKGENVEDDKDGDDDKDNDSAHSDSEAIWDGEKTFWENLNLEELD